VILGHHAGEEAVFAALAGGGTTAAAGLVLVARVKLAGLARWLRRR
jgi:hypothetical protein